MQTAPTVPLELSARPAGPARPFDASGFGIVGVYDIDWLPEPRLLRLLDYAAASPGGVTGVRFFGALSSGTREDTKPVDGGSVWRDRSAPPDFATTLDALAVLTSRGLTPFIVLSFSPPALAAAPATPPRPLDAWKQLVRAFLDALARDPRFGPDRMSSWWFEVWNEPNFPWFWSGSFEEYLDLYRATAEAVRESGHAVRLGGPALAWLPPEEGEGGGARLMERFLRFLAAEPGVRCDFVSFHGKGTWRDEPPSLATALGAAEETARLIRAANSDRFRGLTIVNDEADMKVGFDVPFEPRMTEQFPVWLAALAVAYDELTSRHADLGLRFLTSSDNANQHLIRAPFDGRRSLLTRTHQAETDLVKLPVFHFYEILRLLRGVHGTAIEEREFQARGDLFRLVTVAPDGVAVLLARYDDRADPGPCQVSLALHDVPWDRVNVALFQIDGELSNSFAAAAGRLPTDPSAIRAVRIRAELTPAANVMHGVALPSRTYRTTVSLARFQVTALWITPVSVDVPAPPTWIAATVEHGDVLLRWEPVGDAALLSWEVVRLGAAGAEERISPPVLRGAMWVDTAPPPGVYRYAVNAISVSGVAGPRITSVAVRV